MTELEEYYNKFNEEKRLNSRHGQVEFITSMKYIHKYIDTDKIVMIGEIGAFNKLAIIAIIGDSIFKIQSFIKIKFPLLFVINSRKINIDSVINILLTLFVILNAIFAFFLGRL